MSLTWFTRSWTRESWHNSRDPNVCPAAAIGRHSYNLSHTGSIKQSNTHGRNEVFHLPVQTQPAKQTHCTPWLGSKVTKHSTVWLRQGHYKAWRRLNLSSFVIVACWVCHTENTLWYTTLLEYPTSCVTRFFCHKALNSVVVARPLKGLYALGVPRWKHMMEAIVSVACFPSFCPRKHQKLRQLTTQWRLRCRTSIIRSFTLVQAPSN